MIVFVIPLQSKRVSRSWERVNQLLERCLRSVCNQTVSDFRVIVVCHERPTIHFNHPHISYLDVDFPPPPNSSDSNLNLKRTDKGRKALAGLVAAARFGPTHTMLVDADDCVSDRLAAHVQASPESNGWFVANGYRYEENQQALYFKRRFYTLCGTCNILRYDLNALPSAPEYNRGYGYYKYYIDHAKVRAILADRFTPLAPLPFAGAIYVTETGENGYYEGHRLHQGLIKLLNSRPLTPAIQREFCLYPLSQLPLKERQVI